MREKRDMTKPINLESKIIFPTKWKDENCWNWVGAYNRKHPIFKAGDTTIIVRRMMWESNIVDNGESPLNKNDVIHSIFGSYLCVNPFHLERLTRTQALDLGYLPQAEKAKETFAKITHCPKGHEYTLENTAYNNNCRWATDRKRKYSTRYCKTCNLLRYYARKRNSKKGSTRLVKDYEGRGLLTTEVMDIAFRREIRLF